MNTTEGGVEITMNITESLLPITVSDKFSVITKNIDKKNKRLSFFFSDEKFQLECLEDKYFLNFFA